MSNIVPEAAVTAAKDQLDAHVREIIQWHFSPETGSSFWLNWAKTENWDPREHVHSYADLAQFPP